MTKKIINLKRDNKGGTYIELTFAILVIAMLLAIVVDFFPVFVKIKALNEYASYTARMIALEGGINDKVIDGMNLYKTTEGLSLSGAFPPVDLRFIIKQLDFKVLGKIRSKKND